MVPDEGIPIEGATVGRAHLFRPPRLGPAGRRVISYFEHNGLQTLVSTAVDIGAATGTSDATVIRTVQAMGFSGLDELKQAIVDHHRKSSGPAADMRQTFAEAASKAELIDAVLDSHGSAIRALGTSEGRILIEQAGQRLSKAKRIGIFGIGPTSWLAGYVNALLVRTGRACFLLNKTGSMLADDLIGLAPGDVILALASGSKYREVEVLLAECSRKSIELILLTDTSENDMARSASLVIPIARGRPGRMALHGATLVCLETIVLTVAAMGPAVSLAALDELDRLRGELKHRDGN